MRFLPNVSKINSPEEEKKDQDKIELSVDEKAKLQSAWRYSNLLQEDKNAGEIGSKVNGAFGKGVSIKYKFDCSKQMSDTIQGSVSHKLDKSELLHLITF
jgi:hypothetical protein